MPKIRKMKITDGDGNEYKVEEELDEELPQEPAATPKQDEQEAGAKASLTDDEIKALKDLAACAPQLMALTKKDADPEQPTPEQPAEEEEEIIEDEDSEEEEPVHDSFSKHTGKTAKRVNDTTISESSESSINSAWSKRFGGE